MQLAGQSDTGSRSEEGDGPVFQNGKAEESRVSKNGLNLLKMVATVKPSIAQRYVGHQAEAQTFKCKQGCAGLNLR